ncbi:MAG: M48 family metallopeptidase [Phycisphaerales bacterium]
MIPTGRDLRFVLVAAAIAASLAGCVSVEGTNRRQFNVLSVEQERAMGEEAYAEMLAETRVVSSGPMVEQVNRVGARLADATARRHPASAGAMRWQFAVIAEPEVNAWALPGGKCGVNVGLLEFVESDDELAIVMGHEIAHAVARHGGERISQSMAASIVGELALGGLDPAVQQAVFAAYGLGVALPFSRSHEREADRLGLMIAAEAGYDPRAAISLWTRMAAQGGGGLEFLSTHPLPESRVEELQALIPEAEAVRQAAAVRAPRP